ncbi:MAG: hypothetical protein K2Y05_06490 [Hyphomicrobiaceae bacterium]|nr:hypothetical protein [Hyphomicrobiaceae bacterium]
MTAPKIIATLAVSTLVTVVFAGSAFAGGSGSATEIRREALERREAAQKEAIADGRRDGGLTIWEKWRLNGEQKRIDRLEREALSDGKITKQEYVEIRSAQRAAEGHIAAERSDGQVRGWWWRTFSR